MFLMWIVPFLLIILVVYAVSGDKLFSVLKPVSTRACPHCNRAVQSDWKNCPYCGQVF